MIRAFSLQKHGLLPNLTGELESKAPNFYRWATAVIEVPSVKSTFDEDQVVAGIKRKRAQLAAQAQA